MAEVVLHGKGHFDLVAEVDLFAQQLTVPLRAARHHQVLITDKTPANVLALASLVLDTAEPQTATMLSAMRTLCRDKFDQEAGGDRMREKVLPPPRPGRGRRLQGLRRNRRADPRTPDRPEYR
ncbi:hypothetical protein [Streptomyces sp. NPDC002133]|uniref:hypothetical protein n=1 Tax=Streptomyces sp. NPDC002133 TaxID=3154409 RepID=UPI00331B07E6